MVCNCPKPLRKRSVAYLGNLTPVGAMALGERPVKTYWDIELEIEVSGDKGSRRLSHAPTACDAL